MENVNFASALLNFESICCSTIIVKETAITVARSLLWLIYFHASILETCRIVENFALTVIDKSKKPDGEVVDDGKIEDDAGPNGCHGTANGETGDTFGEEGDGNGEGDDYEDDEYDEGDDTSDQEGSDNNGEEEDGDNYDEVGSDEEDDDEEYEDEDDEEDDTEDDMDGEPLLSHAQQFYASDSFDIFKHEYKKSGALSLDVTGEGGSAEGLRFKYEVQKMGHFYSHHHKVTALAIDGERVIVNCCCNFFSNTGILCSHALLVLQCLKLEKIPDCYLLTWRMKSRNGRSMDDLFFQRRRQSRPSLDDCLSGDFGKSSVDESNAFEDDVCTDADHSGIPILRHAKHIYVQDIYDLFREQYKKSEYLFIHIDHETIDRRGIVAEFEVYGCGGKGKTKVHAEASGGTVVCSCRKFEHSGILCSHALAVFDCLCIVRIPPKYIVRKFLKDDVSCAQEKIHGPHFCKLEQFTRHRVMQSRLEALQRMAFKSGQMDVFENFVEETFHEMQSKLGDLPEDHNEEESTSAKQEKAFKGQANFYDDQLIKCFTYKKSETRKRKLFELLRKHPRSL